MCAQVACEVQDFALASANVVSDEQVGGADTGVSLETQARMFFGGSMDAVQDVIASTASWRFEFIMPARLRRTWRGSGCGGSSRRMPSPQPSQGAAFVSLCAAGRLDFLVAFRDRVALWTCEVGECGASLCSVDCDAQNCAALNWAVRCDPTGRFPRPLPKITSASVLSWLAGGQGNSGWKS